ncbi:MAG: HAD-IIB family hydrolase [Aestuariivirga sp.]|nr:HAD-IIB family hydrolase [Aestuariivirga sp.]MCA3559847.1 HAD-IIB family hydrolase [Aestuariivirga sp.]
MQPLAQAPRALLAGVKAVLTDIDDTLTLHGRLPAEAYDALWKLRRAGIKAVPITGRPAGWCDLIARQWPVDGVVGENGAFYFRYDEAAKKMIRVYAQTAEVRRANTERLWKIARRVLRDFPGTAIASDQAYREIDVAIDFCEDVPPLPLATAQKIAGAFHAEGAAAKVSSIHVNAWFGDHDKLTMSKRFLAESFDIRIQTELDRIAYCGDSPNDAPMFAVFPLGIGVANIRPYAKLMAHLPNYVTAGECGHGFAEFVDAVLMARHA